MSYIAVLNPKSYRFGESRFHFVCYFFFYLKFQITNGVLIARIAAKNMTHKNTNNNNNDDLVQRPSRQCCDNPIVGGAVTDY